MFLISFPPDAIPYPRRQVGKAPVKGRGRACNLGLRSLPSGSRLEL